MSTDNLNQLSRLHAALGSDLSALLAAMADLVLIFDVDGRYLEIAPTNSTLLYRPAASLIGKTLHEVCTVEKADFFLLHVRRAMTEGQMHRVEYRIQFADREIWFDASVSPLGKDSVMWMARDITNSKRAEEQLRHQLHMTEAITTSLGEGVYALDEHGRVTFMNPAAEAALGWKQSELLGREMHEVIHLQHAAGAPPGDGECPLLLSSRGRKTVKVDSDVFTRKDGSLFPVSYTSAPIITDDPVVRAMYEAPGLHVDTGDGAGVPAESQSRAQRKDEKLAGSVVTFIDISERKRAESALRESEEKYRELIQNATYGIYRATVKGQFLDANPALVEMLGYGSEEELLAVNILDVYENPDDRYWILNRFRDAGGVAGFEVKWKRKDGTPISARLNGRASYGQDGSVKHFEVIVENVTARRSLEQQLREAQKMEAVGRLAGGIAHDFNNLLMIVNGYAELTIQRCKEELSHEYAHQIIFAQKRAAELVRQLLAFSRKQVLEPKVLNLNSLLTELSRMLPRIIGEDVELSFVLTEDPGLVQADPTQLEQVVVNLVVNARDAMPHGGNLRLETSSVHQEVSYSGDHPDVPQGDYVMLAVSDTGIGMDAKTRSHIFEPFFTTKESGKGTGLGLATAYGTIKQSGGFISVSSEPQGGTTFRIYLPEVQGAQPVLQIPHDSSELPGGTETVLLVEDETAVRTVTRAVLESLGYKVLESANGAEALKVAALRREAIDVILTDLIMPGIRGPELVARLRELHPEAAIIYMSGHSDGILRIQELGKDAVFLQKPFSVNGLAQSLRTALDKNAAAHRKETGRCG